MFRINWPDLVKDELVQFSQEGYDVTQGTSQEHVTDVEGWVRFKDKLRRSPRSRHYAYDEPDALSDIRKDRRSAEHRYAVSHLPDLVEERILGGWLGRSAGCLLGKPVEGWDMERIRRYLDRAGLAEIDGYLPDVGEGADAIKGEARTWLHGTIEEMPRDDDLDYTVLGLHLLETCGLAFDTKDVGRLWLERLPYYRVYTAERAAYRNLVWGVDPPDSATFANPYREYIGAQIRADIFGYVLPGDPSKAAELAWKDARLSHSKNGIYGAMFVAAGVAAAFVARDPEEALYVGISEVPDRSRLNEAVRLCLSMYREGRRFAEALKIVRERYGRYSWVHTIPNACVVTLALLYGEMDFSRTVGLAVMCGWDTDCNGATAGSILGVMLGAKGIPSNGRSP